MRCPDGNAAFVPPASQELSDEELVVAICLLQCRDRPQMLRLAAQLVSRATVEVRRLTLVARRERVDRILAELARQALKVDPVHPVWCAVQKAFDTARPLREPILHWSRIAEPVMRDGRINASSWRLVA